MTWQPSGSARGGALAKAMKNLKRKTNRWKHADWKHAFEPVKRRIMLKHMLHFFSAGILSGLASALLLAGLSFLMPMEHFQAACIAAGLTAASALLLIGWLKRPSVLEAARMIDQLGLQEKMLTACELDDRDDEIAGLQRKDAIASLSRLDKKRISLRIPRHHGYAYVLLAAALILVNLIPNPMEDLIRQRKELRLEIQVQLEELKETEEQLVANGTLTEEQRQELARLVDELAERLKREKDYKEAVKEISKTEEQLAALTDQIREGSIGKLVEQLRALEETQALAQALSDRSLASLEAGLEQLREQLEQAENKAELAEKLKAALEKAAEAMPEGEIKTSLAAASNSLSNGQTGAAADQLSAALNQAVHASSSLGDAKYALQQMRSSIAQAAGDARYVQNTGSQSGENSGSENPNEGDKDTNSSGNDNPGQGSNNGQDSQNGEGSGSGTTSQSSGQSGSVTTGSQNGDSQTGNEHAQTIYEQIYAPERLGDGGEITYVPGQSSGGGDNTSEHGGRGDGDLFGFIPYQDVYQEYRNQAMNSMDRRALPPGIREMVREYFDALGD
jgi:hypothetical protein